MMSLGGTDILQTSTGLFEYPSNATMVGILGNGTQVTGNAVMQSGALGWRQADIVFSLADLADVAAIRSLSETHEATVYVDHLAATHAVRVLTFSAAMDGNALWACQASLVEEETFFEYS
jgi:hypothetical protein